ncbi:acyltransferase family protein [Rhodoferax sp.]|uniref:acyltransferase family protein n=1 Tax=Rhodoferax sp. TaxID=50421 RepID=UPI00263496CE|nr:acyltransferase family protein [Rhodoferax sp.]MDD2808231.1 acyltransferase family protein [Rhodoferax sp.]
MLKVKHYQPSYRPDVDGLRAVAVLAVILYHGGLKALPGGYVGVDIFFVISGFVITSAIQPDMAAGRFLVRDFYERRIRRIFPALFAMVAASLCVGCWVMMPDDLKRLGQSSVANAVFASNFFFLKDSGYFGATAAAKPLLHTWSLAVEEQFYLLLPLYLVLLKRWSEPVMRGLTVGLSVASLMLAVVATRYEPNISFFMLPTRAWELLAGVMLAQGMLPAPRSVRGEWLRAGVGMGLIAFALVFYTEKTPFPGLAALPPVLGAVLIISAGLRNARGVNVWLSSKPMVFIGQISYPLYLWHFPLLGFAGYMSLTGLGVAQTVAVNGVIVLCALVSWRFVEQPIRQRRVLAGQRLMFAFGVACIAVTLLAGLLIHFGRGFESRFEGDRQKIVRAMTDRIANKDACMNFAPDQISKGELCHLGVEDMSQTDVVVWGDSHAEALAPGIADMAANAGRSALFAGQHGCGIGLHFQETGWSDRACVAFSKAMLAYLMTTPSINKVVLVSRWSSLRAPPLQAPAKSSPASVTAAQALGQVVAQLRMAGKQVWLVGPVPDVKTLVPRALYLKSMGFAQDFEIRQSLAEYVEIQKNTLAVLRHLAEQPGVSLVLPHERLCQTAWCDVAQDGYPLYFDDNHLSTHGAKIAAQVLAPLFK